MAMLSTKHCLGQVFVSASSDVPRPQTSYCSVVRHQYMLRYTIWLSSRHVNLVWVPVALLLPTKHGMDVTSDCALLNKLCKVCADNEHVPVCNLQGSRWKCSVQSIAWVKCLFLLRLMFQGVNQHTAALYGISTCCATLSGCLAGMSTWSGCRSLCCY